MNIVLICKTVDKEDWYLVSNMIEDHAFRAAELILSNVFNEYMGYINAGVEYRFVRESELSRYDLALRDKVALWLSYPQAIALHEFISENSRREIDAEIAPIFTTLKQLIE